MHLTMLVTHRGSSINAAIAALALRSQPYRIHVDEHIAPIFFIFHQVKPVCQMRIDWVWFETIESIQTLRPIV